MTLLLVTLQWLVAASYPLAVAYAVVSDIRRLEIPNWTCITIALAFLPAALFRDIDYSVIAGHYGIGCLLFIAGMILFARNLAGGGDMKLLAAAGVWIGWADLPAYLALLALLGGGWRWRCSPHAGIRQSCRFSVRFGG